MGELLTGASVALSTTDLHVAAVPALLEGKPAALEVLRNYFKEAWHLEKRCAGCDCAACVAQSPPAAGAITQLLSAASPAPY